MTMMGSKRRIKTRSSVNKQDDDREQKYLCGKCEIQVSDDHQAVECDICEMWFHVKCENIPEAVYKYMMDVDTGSKVSWFCSYSKRGCAKLHRRMNKIKW